MTRGKASPKKRTPSIVGRRRDTTGKRGTAWRRFPIVGIGASAGGLDAFKKFFSAMPPDSGAAFVIIQHLDPTRESLTAELVGTYTQMRVVQVEDGMRIEPNRVYVIPPNAYLSIQERTLRLSAPTPPRSLRMAVDYFLHSLAEDQHEHAIGVILSGTGTDGTLGLKEIKAGGGMTMVQDPQTVQHDGMPRSAMAGGCADYVLPAERMADALLAYVRHAPLAAAGTAASAEKASDPLATALAVLRERTKFDFSGYKKGTLRRRIQRRMSLMAIADLPKYVDLLRGDPAEATALFKDLLINVTSFFREPAAWDVLQERVIRRLVAEKEPDAALRVWIPACATGEEAYSIAMVVSEEVQAAGKGCRVQIFASDVDAEALETARAGIYPEGIAAHVSAERLSRFFIKRDHSYQVKKELRDTVVFAQQSLVSDPPFSRLDLVSCRNLFIYLEAAVQERLVPLLHFALLEGGYLFLGSAEGVGMQEDLFEAVSAKWRIYRRIGPTRHDKLQFPLAPAPVSLGERGSTTRLPSPARLATLAQQVLLRRYTPACVIVNRTGEILYFHGRTEDYLVQPAGPPTQDLIARARNGLRSKLRSAIREAVAGNPHVVLRGVQVRRGDTFARMTIMVEPLDVAGTEARGLWLVSLEDESLPSAPVAAETGTESRAADAALVQQLESELKSTREDLQQSIEDLRAANEELMSVNEEFQSSNEELETSKEELQSLNEELTTANAQLASKIGELEATNDDLDNLLASTNIATLFLDTKLQIRRFTPAAAQLFSLIPSDIGRPIGDITQKFTDPALPTDIAAVLERPVAPKTEVQGYDGRWYVRQVLPYHTRGDRTEGVVITFSDVAAEALDEARRYAESIVDTVRDALLVLDADLRVQSANQSFYARFRMSREETVGRLLYELGNRQWDIAKLRMLLGEVLPKQGVLNDFELEATFPSIGSRVLHLNARVIDRGPDRPHLVLLAMQDLTEQMRADAAARKSEDLYRSLFENMLNGCAYCRMLVGPDDRPDFEYLSVNAAFETLTGLKGVVGKRVSEVIPGIQDSNPELFEIYGRVARIGRPERFEAYVDALKMWFHISVYSPETGYFVATFDVITERKQAAEALRESEERFRGLFENAVDGVALQEIVLDAGEEPVDYRYLQVNRAFERLTGLRAADVVGRRATEIHPGIEQTPRLAIFGAAALAGESAVFEWFFEPTQRYCNVTTYQVGRGRCAAVFEDITEGRRAQEALRESEARTRIAEELGQRQAELAHALRVSTMGELASGLAHELNQPLSSIANGLEACARFVRSGKATGGKLLALLDDASSEVIHAGDILRNLREFLEKRKPRLRRIDLREGATTVSRLLKRELDLAHVRLLLDLTPKPLWICADRIQIKQVLVNLIQNAIDAASEAGGSKKVIEVAMRKVANTAEVTVRDRGAEASPAVAARMFEPFFTTKSHGLGMGLAICRSIVEAHGGRISAERPADGGPGTTIRFTLPLYVRKGAREGGAG